MKMISHYAKRHPDTFSCLRTFIPTRANTLSKHIHHIYTGHSHSSSPICCGEAVFFYRTLAYSFALLIYICIIQGIFVSNFEQRRRRGGIYIITCFFYLGKLRAVTVCLLYTSSTSSQRFLLRKTLDISTFKQFLSNSLVFLKHSLRPYKVKHFVFQFFYFFGYILQK